SDPEELRTEGAVRVGEGRSGKGLRAKSQVGRSETRCRTIGVAVEVEGPVDRSARRVDMIVGAAEHPLLPVPSVTTGKRGQAPLLVPVTNWETYCPRSRIDSSTPVPEASASGWKCSATRAPVGSSRPGAERDRTRRSAAA